MARLTRAVLNSFTAFCEHFGLELFPWQREAFSRATERVPGLVEAYNAGVTRGEPAEFAPAPVAKRELPTSAAWTKIETLAKVKLEKGGATTLEQAIELVGNENPTLYREAFAE